MKKVLFVLPPTTGGAEKITATFGSMLNKKLFEPVFVIVGRKRGEVVNYIPKGMKIFFVPAFSLHDFVWQKIFLLIKIVKPYCVFSSITPINCHVIHAAKKARVRSIVRCNCAVDRIKGEGLNQVKFFYPQADFVVAQTSQMRNELITALGLSSDNVVTLHNPIDKDLILHKANEGNPYRQEKVKKYVWVGRFNEIKRVDVLVRAFARVLEKEPQSKLFLVGKKEESNNCYIKIIALVKELGIESNVFFTDFQTNPYKWIKNADCLVLTSRSEASPNVVFESLYLGTPVVVSACTPDLGIIITEGNGFVVEIGNIEKTAEAMLKVKRGMKATLTREPASAEQINKLFE